MKHMWPSFDASNTYDMKEDESLFALTYYPSVATNDISVATYDPNILTDDSFL